MQENQAQQNSKRRNSEQRRGAQAWNDVRRVKELDSSNTEKKLEKAYRTLARGLNAMIQTNGLGQTLAFFKAKGKEQHSLLLSHLTEWMQDPKNFHAENSEVMQSSHDLLQWILDAGTSSDDYRRATTECLAFGLWLRRFAEAELQEPGAGEDF